jgi:hypothetical protein
VTDKKMVIKRVGTQPNWIENNKQLQHSKFDDETKTILLQIQRPISKKKKKNQSFEH